MVFAKDIFGNFSEKFPLLQRFYELYQQLTGLAKDAENTIRKSSEITVLEIIELIVIATKQNKESKKQTLIQIMRKLDTLKVFAHMAKDVKQINDSKYNEIDGALQNVGKMFGGWI